jgi:4-oxalocrotonate tautomerase
MPLVEVKLVDEIYSSEEKIELISRITEAVISVKGEAIRPLTWVLIEPVPSLHWGTGGKVLSAESAMAAALGHEK